MNDLRTEWPKMREAKSRSQLGNVLVFMALTLSATAGVQLSQDVKLVSGWNAFYLTVAPTDTADRVFADWPVDFVAAYDAAAFQETRQYSGSGSTEGAVAGGYKTWYRGDAGATSLVGVPANTVYLCRTTNAFTRTVYGRPVAPRISWHASSPEQSMNLVGLSVSDTTTIGRYFEGLDVDNTVYKKFYGSDPAGARQRLCGAEESLALGDVLVMNSSKVSDWSGVLNVTPISGVDFGTNSALATVTVRNDGLKARTVRVALGVGSAANVQDVPPVPTGLMIKDASTVLASTSTWRDFSPTTPFEKHIESGETLTIQLALDRTKLSPVRGTYYGALLNITDVDGGSGMRVVVPVEATSDGGASAETAWPKGIWLAQAELDQVTFAGQPRTVTNVITQITNIVDLTTGQERVETNVYETVSYPVEMSEVTAGGKMKVRLPLYVDRDGQMTLLQRFWYGRDTNGVLHVIAGSAASDVPLTQPRRVSTAFLPTDQVKIPATNGVFGVTAAFPFVVSETSNINPMRHALHPQHDGLGFDFKTPAPSGDDLENYTGKIKPELFSITNTVHFTWAPTAGTVWQPEETLKGMLNWEFGGLRHEGVIRARGAFVMKRISAATLEK